MKYKIQKTKGYYKSLKKIDPAFQKQIEAAIEENLSDPYLCSKCRKLKLSKRGARYRFRLGDYRVLYDIDENNKAVIIYWVGKRANVYLD
ncbi:hypothetical protein B9Q05_12575 [Candidatus Marsarchaeota G2 archaeon ECH_B_1]|uniref:Addiction module toxin RelE n=1 Tax=Candidatus Marsarchaeota G2 archaeon ECH_B_1 TaxID=1978159 RepID=A0A2R6BJ18_9ARCH|nr:MAG: hypothetical protein B9Q05_12575 [Candidatus Marsarchaeota G2 archaeon ECH_B_1]